MSLLGVLERRDLRSGCSALEYCWSLQASRISSAMNFLHFQARRNYSHVRVQTAIQGTNLKTCLKEKLHEQEGQNQKSSMYSSVIFGDRFKILIISFNNSFFCVFGQFLLP